MASLAYIPLFPPNESWHTFATQGQSFRAQMSSKDSEIKLLLKEIHQGKTLQISIFEF